MHRVADPILSHSASGMAPPAFDRPARTESGASETWVGLAPPVAGRAAASLISAFALVLARQTSRHELLLSVAPGQAAPLAGVTPVRLDLRPSRRAADLLAALSGIVVGSAAQGMPDGREADAPIRLDCLEHVSNIGCSFEIATGPDSGGMAHCCVLAEDGTDFDGMSQIMAGRLPHVAQWLASHSGSPLRDCDIVSPSERRRIEQFSSGASVYPAAHDWTLHGLFEVQAKRAPDAAAIMFGDVRWSYGQLDDMSSRLAACLLSRFAVQPGQRVAVVAGRSHLLVAALLGIMRAGCAYAPIDPRHPVERVTRMLDDVDPAVLIVDAENAAAASRYDGDVFVLDIELEHLAPVPEPFASRGGPRSLAYTIFTSGSTGRPNAVAVEHRAVVNTILWRNAFYGIGASDINLQLPSFAFDSSVLDIFGFLAAGASLVVLDESRGLDPDYLGALSARHGVTRLIATASYYRQICGCLARSSRLRSVTVAGEATPPALVSAHFSDHPGVRLTNEYGPTENAVCSAAIDLEDGGRSVPIGRPIPNTGIHVLDPLLRPAGIGVAGEIYLAGAGLARGYVSQPGATAGRFLPCPFAAGGARMYRTGDWAFWRPDGVLEFLGRRDRQVKVRGFRVELGDIEAVLGRFPRVTAALVMAKDRSVAAVPSIPDRYLVAYLAAPEPLNTDQVKAFAAARLPDYMIPGVFCVLPRLPLNTNGKVDEASLRERDDFVSAGAGSPVPMSRLETAVFDACVASLRLPSLGPDQNLFSAGATSLTVMQIVTVLRKGANLELTLLDIYTNPTVRDLAAQLASRLQLEPKDRP